MTRRTQISYAITALNLVMLFWAWWPTVVHLLDLIQTVDVFAHGQVVPFVTLALIWARKDRLQQLTPRYSLWGGVVFAGAVLTWLTGELLDAAILSHIGLITAIQGVVLYAFGIRIYRAVLFPMGFLYLMVPFGYAFVTDLQYLTANMVIGFLDFVGADYTADGVLIELPSGLYEVAQACAGIRFLFTSIVTSILLANLVFKSWQRRLMILCVGFILPIIANIVRVLGILGIAELTDQSFAKDVDHIIYGWVFLSIVLLSLISFAYKVSDADTGEKTDQTVDMAPIDNSAAHTAPLLLVGIALLVLPFASSLIFPSQFNPAYRESFSPVQPLFEESLPGYRLLATMPPVPVPFFVNAEKQRHSALRDNGAVFTVYHAGFDELGPGRRLFQSGNSLMSGEWREQVGYRRRPDDVCGQVIEERRYENGSAQVLLWVIYRVDGDPIRNSLEEKLATAVARFMGRIPSGDVLVLQAPVTHNVNESRDLFSDFLKANFNDDRLMPARKHKVEGSVECAE